MKKRPFEETWINRAQSIRKFAQDVEDGELKWHIDKEDRTIECNEVTDWQIQIDNKLPQPIKGKIFIQSDTWHRLVKGTGDLELVVTRLTR